MSLGAYLKIYLAPLALSHRTATAFIHYTSQTKRRFESTSKTAALKKPESIVYDC